LAAVSALAEGWEPAPAPTWVTYVPSRAGTIPEQVATHVGRALGLPVHDVVERVADRPPQAELGNSVQQLRNVHDAFAIAADLPSGPVLLVDDLTDSRWTLTVVGSALRRAGSGPVLPLVLAAAMG
jgi:ATP-dependent DNA helicase RecQ